MRNLFWGIAGTLALASLGCSGGGQEIATAPLNPSSPTGTSDSTIGTAYLQAEVAQSALAIYTVDVNPVSLTATSRLKETRTAQENDDLYLLSIDNFLNASSFRLTGVSADATNINLDYVITHPFPAPNNVTGTPNGFSNRADLSISGMALFLVDVPAAAGNTYFTDRVANTAAVANADAYFSPAGLLTTSTTANTFPYKVLVDETGSTGSRVGVSNGGVVTGNYGADGWTRSEFGTNANGWTGYGVLHGGQASSNSISLDRDELAASGLSLDVAIIAKYNDPRGGANAAAKRSNRLPPATPNHVNFAYRMPHGALDVSEIAFIGEGGGFIQDQVSGSELTFHVVDWDANATETALPNLADDPVVTNVAQGESGEPTLSVSIPGVTGDATSSIDMTAAPSGGTGVPGSPLVYSETVTKTVTSGQGFGDFTGMVRVEDVEFGAPLAIALDATTLLPLGSNIPEPVTYQAFTVNMLVGNIQPTGDWTLNDNTITDGGTTTITVSNVVDPDSGTFDVQVNWDNGAGFVSVATGLAPGAGPFGPYVSPAYTLANPVVGEMKTIAVRLVDGVSASTNLATNVGPNGSVLTVDPVPPCSNPVTEGTQVFNADFSNTTGNNAWVSGVAVGLPNSDSANYSEFKSSTTGYCVASGTQTTLSGGMVNTGGDVGLSGCGISSGAWINDYYTNVNNNVISPAFATTGATAATLVFDSHKAARFDATNVAFRVYYSTDNGVSWQPAIYNTTQTAAAAINEAGVSVVLPAGALGQASVRLRYEFVDLLGVFSAYYSNTSVAGWAFDNVRVYTCP